MATDRQLKSMNDKVYSVDPNYTQNGQSFKAVNQGDVKTFDGQQFKVIATQNNIEKVQVSTTNYQSGIGEYTTKEMVTKGSGFQGMAVAPIVNGKTDISQTTVVAAGTDPTGLLNPDTESAAQEIVTGTSGQYRDAKSFLDKVQKMNGVEVTQLSGYSQSASYMLRLGVEDGISTTVFNGFYSYSDLSKEELEEIKKNPLKYKNFRFLADDTAPMADAFHDSSKYPGVIWLPGGKHSPLSTFDPWFFPEGSLIKNGKLKNGTVVSNVHQALRVISETNIPKLQSRIKMATGSQKISLRDELLETVAQDAVLSAEDYTAKVKNILSDSKEKVQKMILEAHNAANNVNVYLNYSEIDALFADFTLSDFWNEGIEDETMNAAKQFQTSLNQFSESLMEISQRIQETDRQGAAGFNNVINSVQKNWGK